MDILLHYEVSHYLKYIAQHNFTVLLGLESNKCYNRLLVR